MPRFAPVTPPKGEPMRATTGTNGKAGAGDAFPAPGLAATTGQLATLRRERRVPGLRDATGA